MSKRAGRSKLVFGAIALTFAAGAIAAAITFLGYQHQHAEERQQAAANHTPDTRQQIETSCTRLGAGSRTEALSCVTEIPDANSGDSYTKYDLKAQQDMAEWALAMFIATLFGLGISGVGLWYVREALLLNRDATEHAANAAKLAREANDQARSQFVAERRPWLSYEVVDPTAQIIGDKVVFSFDFKITNHGQTPATEVDVRIQHVGDFKENERFAFEHMTVLERQRTWEPGDVVFPSVAEPLLLERTFSVKAEEGGGIVNVVGWVRYRFQGATRFHLTPFREVIALSFKISGAKREPRITVQKEAPGIAPD